MQPKFEKGEKALFVNPLYPEFAGEHVVTKVKVVDGRSVKLIDRPDFRGVMYLLDGISDTRYVRECDMRKVHEPADMGFSALLSSLKNGVTREDLRRYYRR